MLSVKNVVKHLRKIEVLLHLCTLMEIIANTYKKQLTLVNDVERSTKRFLQLKKSKTLVL